jgi:hypothetical protein
LIIFVLAHYENAVRIFGSIGPQLPQKFLFACVLFFIQCTLIFHD